MPQYQHHHEEVQDIMSKMPHWIVRRGITLLFAVVILLFAGAYFIHYPDVITTQVNITSANPPVKIVAQPGGKISELFVQNNAAVQENAPIYILENAARYADIRLLQTLLNQLDTSFNLAPTLRRFNFAQPLQLGALQGGYAALYQAVNQYLFFTDKHFTTQKVAQLQSQLTTQHQLNEELQHKDIMLQQQLMLEQKRFKIDSQLAREKVIAPLELDNSKRQLLDKQMTADATRANLLQNKLQQTEYLKTITDLQQQSLQQENDLQQKVREQVKQLQGQLEVWEQQYLVKSPVAGKVSFFKFWKAHQFVSSGEAVLMIVPPVQHYVAKATLPVFGAGKVKKGQKVLIKLSAYPFREFGMIRGNISNVSAVALDTAYAMDIQLANGLLTTAHRQIPSQPQLPGIAEVLTNDMSILERLFYSLRPSRY
ncbi:HlyD family secretion protein [Chitinophaga sp. GbtcB8]|uniref:HlyD family secretion protein n=1 Tax=Chitinophaga sp. GbtcB8 TaxID=2824753 RepID=UPI001C3047E0|nr:HlyD family efflux transporter periplasmic adaptor subunit [Chitinophaga sp. GbtcB8]